MYGTRDRLEGKVCGIPAIRWRIGVYGRTVFFPDVFVNNDRARHVYKAFGFRKRGKPCAIRRAAGRKVVPIRLGRLLLLLAIHSGVPGILSTETRKNKLAEEG
jgi:hypothetical protein